MLRTVGDQPTLWEAILPAELLKMSEELSRIDRLLDDERFFAPYRAFFHARLGRPSIPIEVYLRLMFLKYRYRLGFETLCAEVGDSISWQRFCRIPLGGGVPHPTTLMKITSRCGEQAVGDLNRALVSRASEAKVLKTAVVRADTTVIEANVCYPVDSRLLSKGISAIVRLAKKIHEAGLGPRTKVSDRSKRAESEARQILNTLRMRALGFEAKKEELTRLNVSIARMAVRTVSEADVLVRNARRQLRSKTQSAQVTSALRNLGVLVERVGKVAVQTRQRVVRGEVPDGATRIVSLHDPDARPIRKGRLGRPVEFGYKAQVIDNEDGVVLDWHLTEGNPADARLLLPAIKRIGDLTGSVPRCVTADRGYGEAGVEDALLQAGVETVVIPRKGRPSASRRKVEQGEEFRRTVRWRTGAEGRISALKRQWGCRRTQMDRSTGARTWTGHGIFAHNLVKIAGLGG